MPDRLYTIAATLKPRPADHLYAHPLDIMIAAFSAITGAILTAAVGSEWDPSWPIAQMPEYGQAMVGILLLLGGAGVITGLFWRGRMDTEWLLERLGLVALIVGWSAYAVAALFFRSNSVVSAMLPLAAVTGYTIRLRSLSLIERRIRGAIRRRGGTA